MILGPPNQEPRLEDLSFLLGHTYDLQTCMSEAHPRPSQRNLPPFKVTPTTLKPACQEPTYDPHSSTYDPSRSRLRPSNLHVRSPPTTLTAPPTTLQGHAYDPQTCMSGAHLRPSQTLKPTYDPSRSHLRPSNLHVRKAQRPFSHFGRIQRYYPKRVEGRRERQQTVPRSCFSVVWCSHRQSAECS